MRSNSLIAITLLSIINIFELGAISPMDLDSRIHLKKENPFALVNNLNQVSDKQAKTKDTSILRLHQIKRRVALLTGKRIQPFKDSKGKLKSYYEGQLKTRYGIRNHSSLCRNCHLRGKDHCPQYQAYLEFLAKQVKAKVHH